VLVLRRLRGRVDLDELVARDTHAGLSTLVALGATHLHVGRRTKPCRWRTLQPLLFLSYGSGADDFHFLVRNKPHWLAALCLIQIIGAPLK